jgi:hypothetical protein
MQMDKMLTAVLLLLLLCPVLLPAGLWCALAARCASTSVCAPPSTLILMEMR